MGFVRTLLGDIPPEEMGFTLAHEHIVCRPPYWAQRGESDLLLDDPERSRREVQEFYGRGGRTIVDATAVDYGRDVEAVAEISQSTGVNVIATAGFNKSFLWSAPLPGHLRALTGGYPTYQAWVESASVEALADFIGAEITRGLEGTCFRAGQVKFGTGYNAISPLEIKTMEAAAAVHFATGAPVHSHTEAGTMGLQQMEILKRLGVPLRRVSFGHMDRNLDLWYHRRLAQEGAFLSFDGVGKIKYHTESALIEHILQLVRDGFEDQILLSGDTARRSYYAHYGWGPGLSYPLRWFIPQLKDMAARQGLDGGRLVEKFYIENPMRCMTFETERICDV